jgi:hypothetical protein
MRRKTMQRSLIENVRRRLPHYLGPETSVRTGLTIGEQQQTIAGTYIPTDDELAALAKRMHLTASEFPNTAAVA